MGDRVEDPPRQMQTSATGRSLSASFAEVRQSHLRKTIGKLMMNTAELLHALDVSAAGAVAATVASQMLDFKASAGRSVNDTVRNVAEAIASLANADGGSVVVGVSDTMPGMDAFSDSCLDPDATKLRIYELTDPHLVVDWRRAGVPQRRRLVRQGQRV